MISIARNQIHTACRSCHSRWPYDPASPLMGTDPKELKARSWRDICTPTFTAVLFTRAKNWKQPSVSQQIKKMVYTYGGIYIWNIMQPLKRSVTCYNMDEAWGHNTKQNKPVAKKKKILWFHSYEVSKAVKITETESRKVVANGWGKWQEN